MTYQLHRTCDECKQTKHTNDFRDGPDADRTLCSSCAAKAWGDGFQCRECGEFDRAKFWIPEAGEEFAAAQLCHRCHFWHGKLQWKAEGCQRSVIVDGVHYWIAPDAPQPGWGSGHSGRPFLVRFHDGREVLTRNLWCQGDIPERFRDRLPDNATFATWQEAQAAARAARDDAAPTSERSS